MLISDTDELGQQLTAEAAAELLGWTYTECSTTPRYTARADTGVAAAQPRTRSSSSTATRRSAGIRRSANSSQLAGGAESKVACPVAIPAR